MATYSKHQLRISQAVSTFGPGAVVDLRDESVMMAGIDFWPSEPEVRIQEPNLERILHVQYFRSPSTAESLPGQYSHHGDLPFVIFPRWMVCPKCNRLAPVGYFMSALGMNKRPECPACHCEVYPARLIVACHHGHIDDFPWIWWTHRGYEKAKDCKKPALFLKARGTTASLSDLELTCKTCGARTTLAGALQKEKLISIDCQGNRPWLQDHIKCDEKVIPLQRGASNVYFPITVSSLSIPPWSRNVNAILNRYWPVFQAMDDSALEKTIEGMDLPNRLGKTTEEIVQSVIHRKMFASVNENLNERQLRYKEHLALRQEEAGNGEFEDFRTREASIDERLSGFISRVMLVDRLREVRALTAFSRVDPPDPMNRLQDSSSAQQEQAPARLAPISVQRLPWLPGVEVRGEGIYLELDETRLQQWLVYPEVARRSAILNDRYDDMRLKRKWDPRHITPRFLLVHSFAHALMRQLSLESGYSSTAIRERLYAFDPGEIATGSEAAAGILVYTSTADSEGSLGGLVRQGSPDRFVRTVLAAVREAAWCSSDPLCVESEGQGQDGLNMAACHACMLLSETCCEEFNRLLDRATIVGLPSDASTGFFSEFLEH